MPPPRSGSRDIGPRKLAFRDLVRTIFSVSTQFAFEIDILGGNLSVLALGVGRGCCCLSVVLLVSVGSACAALFVRLRLMKWDLGQTAWKSAVRSVHSYTQTIRYLSWQPWITVVLAWLATTVDAARNEYHVWMRWYKLTTASWQAGYYKSSHCYVLLPPSQSFFLPPCLIDVERSSNKVDWLVHSDGIAWSHLHPKGTLYFIARINNHNVASSRNDS